MNLEELELAVLRYLQGVANPLVPVSRMLAHLRGNQRFAQLTANEFLEFVSAHDLFRVIHPAGVELEPELAEVFRDAGLGIEPGVILRTRIPAPRELADAMGTQLRGIMDALRAALESARRKGDSVAEDRLLAVLARAERIQKELDGN